MKVIMYNALSSSLFEYGNGYRYKLELVYTKWSCNLYSKMKVSINVKKYTKPVIKAQEEVFLHKMKI